MPTGRRSSATPPSTASGSCCSRASPRSTTRRCRSRPPKWRCCGSSTPPSCPIPARCWRSWRAARSRPPARRRGAEGRGARASCCRCPPTSPALVELLGRGGKAHPRPAARDDFVGLVRYAPPELVRAACQAAARRVHRATSRAALKALTGNRLAGPRVGRGRPSRRCASRSRTAPSALRQEVLDAPIVKAAFEAFPEAELAGYRLDEQRSA